MAPLSFTGHMLNVRWFAFKYVMKIVLTESGAYDVNFTAHAEII
jgi:hypothetical protein